MFLILTINFTFRVQRFPSLREIWFECRKLGHHFLNQLLAIFLIKICSWSLIGYKLIVKRDGGNSLLGYI